jgi:hypothetical protein
MLRFSLLFSFYYLANPDHAVNKKSMKGASCKSLGRGYRKIFLGEMESTGVSLHIAAIGSPDREIETLAPRADSRLPLAGDALRKESLLDARRNFANQWPGALFGSAST